MAKLETFQESVGNIISSEDVDAPWYFEEDHRYFSRGLTTAWYASATGDLMYQILIPEGELNRAGYYRK